MQAVKLAADWKKFAISWSKVTSPGRPSKKELKIYSDTIDKILRNTRKNVLIFGATPELRDLLSRYHNCQIFIADANLEMVMAMTSLMKKKGKDEIFIISDWLKMPLQENFFDLMIADFTFENLPFELQSKYFENISKWLKPGGYYLERVFLFQPETKPMTIDELIKIFKNKKLTDINISLFWETGVFFLIPKIKSTETRTDVFVKVIDDYLNKQNNKNAIIKKFMDETLKVLPRNKTWFQLSREDYGKMVKKNFKIIEKFNGLDVNMLPQYKNTCPIYLLKTK